MLLEDTAYQKESFSSKDTDIKLLQSTYFAYEVGIISSYSNRICWRKIAKSPQRMFGSCMRLLEQCLRTIVQQATPRLSAAMSQPLRLLNQRNIKSLQIHCC